MPQKCVPPIPKLKLWKKYEVVCKDCGWKGKPRRKGDVYFIPGKCPECGSENIDIEEKIDYLKTILFPLFERGNEPPIIR